MSTKGPFMIQISGLWWGRPPYTKKEDAMQFGMLYESAHW